MFEYLLRRYRSAVDCCRGRDSGCSRPGYGISPLGGGRLNPTTELTQDWENRLLESTNRTLCTRTQEKGAVTPKETDPDLPVSVQESLAEVWVDGGLLQGWGH